MNAVAAQVAAATEQAADVYLRSSNNFKTMAVVFRDLRSHWESCGGQRAATLSFEGRTPPSGVAVEVAPKEMVGTDAMMEEVAILRRLTHPNIVACFGTWRCEDPARGGVVGREYAVFELLDTVLEDAIQNWNLDAHLRQSVMFGIVKALMWLHAQHPQVFHGDLKPLNVMLVAKSHAPKLIDFDSSSQRHTYALKHTASGTELTIAYAAPELLSGSGARSPATDMYALGVLLFQLWRSDAAGRQLFQGLTPSVIIAMVQDGQRPSGRPCDDVEVLTAPPFSIPPIIAQLICACWDQAPDNRPTAQQVHELQQLRRGAGSSRSTADPTDVLPPLAAATNGR